MERISFGPTNDVIELFLADPRTPGPPSVALDVIIIVRPGTCHCTVELLSVQLQPSYFLLTGSMTSSSPSPPLSLSLALRSVTGRTIQYC